MSNWLYKYGIVSSLSVLIVLGLLVAVTLKVFFDPQDIPSGTITAYGILTGLPAIAFGLYKWRNKLTKDD